MKLEGKRVLIIGGGSGIGRAVAVRFPDPTLGMDQELSVLAVD